MIRRAPPGFTLMETLVMLVLVSFSVLLMFQMLGTYRVARERVVSVGAGIDREALFEDWYADSVGGLHAVDGAPLSGDEAAFSAVTLNPMLAGPGAPVQVRWSLEAGPDGTWTVRYAEAGEERWSLPLATREPPRFAYVDEAGKVHASWPPDLGLQQALPRAVALVRGAGADERVHAVAVRGPLEAVDLPFEMEQD